MSDENKTIPYFVHEGEMTRQERTVRRLWIASLMLLALVIASNAGWVVWAFVK